MLFSLKKFFRALWELVVNAEGRGLEALVEQVFDQSCMRSNQLWGCVFFKGSVRMVLLL